jgi:hypothetical protein
LIVGAPAESASRLQPVDSEKATDAILAAKRDLAAIMAVKDAQRAPALSVPSQRLAVPELRTESAAVPPPALRAVKPEAKSDTWLIDAMAQSERDGRDRQRSTDAYRGSARPGTNRDTGRRETTFGSTPEIGQTGRDSLDPLDSRGPRGSRDAALSDRNDAPSSRADEMQSTASALNPLTHFLGDWMTPQDYALLRPGLETSSRGGVDRPGAARSSVPGMTDFALESALKREIPGGFTTVTPTTSTPSPRTNPFLESLNRIELAPPTRVIAAQAPPSPGLVPRAAAQVGPAPAGAAVAAPASPKVPEFAKPGQDEKYFKQLKRF